MLTDLVLRRVPCWKTLSAEQRSEVWANCIHQRLTQPAVRNIKGVLLLSLVGLWFLSDRFIGTGWSYVMLVSIIFVVPEMIDLWVLHRARFDIGADVLAHSAEISAVKSPK